MIYCLLLLVKSYFVSFQSFFVNVIVFGIFTRKSHSVQPEIKPLLLLLL